MCIRDSPYEEWFITDYDCYVGKLYDLLGEYANLDELNYLASKLDDMSRDEYNQFLAAMEGGDHTGSIQELINLTENLDCYDIYPGIENHDDLGRYYIDELEAMQVPDHLRNYICLLYTSPDLFPSSGYVNKYVENPPTAYDIPAEYLTDQRFNTLITEAEKYLGYP